LRVEFPKGQASLFYFPFIVKAPQGVHVGSVKEMEDFTAISVSPASRRACEDWRSVCVLLPVYQALDLIPKAQNEF
jgi:hypothetical protein